MDGNLLFFSYIFEQSLRVIFFPSPLEEIADLGESQYDSIGFGDKWIQIQDQAVWPCSSHSLMVSRGETWVTVLTLKSCHQD